MRLRLWLLVPLCVLALAGCAFTKSDSGDLPQLLLHAKEDVPISVEIADSEETRSKGLMNRQSLEDGYGMWFVFPDDATRSFWMKNTLIPLDIIFFDSSLKAVSLVENMQPCKTADCPSYYSFRPARYALEVPAGFVKKYGVKVGDMVRWEE